MLLIHVTEPNLKYKNTKYSSLTKVKFAICGANKKLSGVKAEILPTMK